ncbi:MAG TPA: ATP-binding protein, partial [Candidatus Acidoferrum sp.]|nr:ATP-binding protein [Candidatus Acidoferrum sp.]
ELVIPEKGNKTHTSLLNELKYNSISKRDFELTALKKDRTEFPIDLSVVSVKLNDKNCLLFTVKDISERKQMESSVNQERAMLENITENIGAGLVIVNKDYRILWANNYLKNLTTDPTNKICYSTFNTLNTICPDCGPKKIFEGSQLDTREYLNKELQDRGLHCWFELIATPLKDKDGKVVAALELTVDITEKKELEEKIREERNKLEAITENINAALMLLNKDYQITWMNKFGKQLHGEVENQTCYSTIHGNDKICSDCGAKKIFGGKALDVHQLTVNKNGKTSILEVTATPMKDKEGKTIGVLELGMDITEIKKLQGELSKYSQRLEDLVKQRTEQLKQTQAKLVKSERLAAIGELAGMVGHDLRNPLTGIKNAAYFLKKKGKTIPEPQATEMLETIDNCVNYSNKIVSDLLDYSREIHLDVQEYSPKNLIIESLAISNVPEKVEILNNVADEPLIKVDPDKIKRVFINLIKNGIEAMPNVGKLTIDGKEVNGALEISFADTGVGIPDEILPKLFAPLFTTKAQGMGFGLAICKRLIEAHGGTIKVKTVNGAGTTFIVSLPIKTENEIGGEEVWIDMPKFSLSTMTKTLGTQ